jgi:hypothetical protein
MADDDIKQARKSLNAGGLYQHQVNQKHKPGIQKAG